MQFQKLQMTQPITCIADLCVCDDLLTRTHWGGLVERTQLWHKNWRKHKEQARH